MIELEFVGVEIEEAVRLMTIDRVPHLRLAFILLDNAVEVMLHKEVQLATQHQDISSALLRQIQRTEHRKLNDPKYETQLATLASRVLSDRKMVELDKEFRAKVNFLVTQHRLEPSVGTIAKKLHRYRNGLYHRLNIRREVLASAALVYFDVACTILHNWKLQRWWSSAEAYDELQRFGISQRELMSDDVAERVSSYLRSLRAIDEVVLREALAGHLSARLDDLESAITFTFGILPSEYDEPEDVYRLAQVDRSPGPPRPGELRSEHYPYTSHSVVGWRRRVEELTQITDRYEMYARYSIVEDSFEGFEHAAYDLAGEVEAAAEVARDQARGK